MKRPTDITRKQLESLSKSELIDMIMTLLPRIQKLEDQVAKNSNNSDKPPSSEGLKKGKPKSLRKKSGRSSGGQKGHQGHTLKMKETPENIVSHKVHACQKCGQDLHDICPSNVEKRQVFDIPLVRIESTEHQSEVKVCPSCNHQTKGTFPTNVKSPVQYGPRLKAQVSYLNTYQLLPWERTCDLIEDFYQHRPAEAIVGTANNQMVRQIEPSLMIITEQLREATVANFDESGVRVCNNLHWLHVASTHLLTHYTIAVKRGKEGMDEAGILPFFKGTAVHDHWKSYFKFDNCDHAACNVHHLRELQFVLDQYAQPWAEDMIALLLDIKQTIAELPEGHELADFIQEMYSQRYDAILSAGFRMNPPPERPKGKRGRLAQTPPKNLLDRLRDYKSKTLAFMYDLNVPFDNNLAERDVRMIKVKQKVSGGFRTREGADVFCSIRSYVSTVRKHGHNVIAEMYQALNGQPFLPLPE